MVGGVMELDLHGMNTYQAQIAIDAALRRCGGGVYRLRLIHGYRGGTAIRDMLWTVYNKRSQVKRLVSISEGVTELVLRQRAVDNQCFTVGAAPARDEAASYVAWGHSLICDPWGTVLHECGSGEEVAVTDLDLSRVDAVRQQLPILSARRTDIYDIRRR